MNFSRRLLSSFEQSYNKCSRIITQDKSQGASQAMLYALGMTEKDFSKGLVAIGSNWFESNPCNNHLNELSQEVKKSLNSNSQLIGYQFNTIGVSDGMTMGTPGMKYSLPSREIIADSYESFVEAHCFDGNIAIPGCDKNLPGCLMGMIRVNKPSFMIYGGSIKPGNLNGKCIDIVDAFQSYGQYLQDGDESLRKKTIQRACPGSGSCGGMYTANTMASAIEAMGVMLPGGSSNPALSPEKFHECQQANQVMTNLMDKNITPKDLVTKKSLENAITVAIALGGSTNMVLHLLAIAKTADVELSLDDFHRLSEQVPVISNLKPSGEYLMYHLHEIGGLPRFMKMLEIKGLLHLDCLTVTGKMLGENLNEVSFKHYREVEHIIPSKNPQSSHLKILSGNLSPNGCVAKISGKEGDYFRGEALVFESEEQFMGYLSLPETIAYFQDSCSHKKVMVIRNQGPKGGPGMPEMLKPTSAIIGMGIQDKVALITDGRFSGGSHGFIIGHISPEAYLGGPISQVNNGDIITINCQTNSIDWESNFKDPEAVFNPNPIKLLENKKIRSGFLKKYQVSVSGSEEGCVTVN